MRLVALKHVSIRSRLNALKSSDLKSVDLTRIAGAFHMLQRRGHNCAVPCECSRGTVLKCTAAGVPEASGQGQISGSGSLCMQRPLAARCSPDSRKWHFEL